MEDCPEAFFPLGFYMVICDSNIDFSLLEILWIDIYIFFKNMAGALLDSLIGREMLFDYHV